MRALLMVVLIVSAAGCCAPHKFASDAMVEAWDGPGQNIRTYAEAGVACDPLLADDPALTDADRTARAAARERRLRTIEEFGLTLKESQASAR